MEKFGLFDLLAALAGGQGNGEETPDAEKGAPPAAEERGARPPEREPAQGAQGVFTAEERRRRAEEALLRHEEISRRIDGRKR